MSMKVGGTRNEGGGFSMEMYWRFVCVVLYGLGSPLLQIFMNVSTDGYSARRASLAYIQRPCRDPKT